MVPVVAVMVSSDWVDIMALCCRGTSSRENLLKSQAITRISFLEDYVGLIPCEVNR